MVPPNCITWEDGPNRAFSVLADLAERGGADVVRGIMTIACHELRVPPPNGSPIEGEVPGRPGWWWRRCTPLAETGTPTAADDSTDDVRDANQYVLVYRRGGPEDEAERHHVSQRTFRVALVVHNRHLIGRVEVAPR